MNLTVELPDGRSVDGPAAYGMASGGPITPEQLLEALAAAPDGAGADAMLAGVRRRLVSDGAAGTEPEP